MTPVLKIALALPLAAGVLFALPACTKRTVPVAVDLPSAKLPPHLKQPPAKIPRVKGKATLDKHLKEQAKQLRQLGDTVAQTKELQSFQRDAEATQ